MKRVVRIVLVLIALMCSTLSQASEEGAAETTQQSNATVGLSIASGTLLKEYWACVLSRSTAQMNPQTTEKEAAEIGANMCESVLQSLRTTVLLEEPEKGAVGADIYMAEAKRIVLGVVTIQLATSRSTKR